MATDLRVNIENEPIVVEPKESFFCYTYFLRNWRDPADEKKTICLPNAETLTFPENLQENDISLKGFISIFNDVIEELVIIKCTLNEDTEESWNALLKYETIEER